MTTIQTEFIQAGEHRFEVQTCGDPGSDRLALCLHGFPEHAISWRLQMPTLADLGYRVWAPNQRGYGNSYRPHGVAAYRMQHLVDDVGRLIDASGCSRVTLFGHDWGGAVAWAAALSRVRPLERLIVMNLPHPARFMAGLRSWSQLRKSWYVLFFQLPWLPEWALRAGNARAVTQAFRSVAICKDHFTEETLEVYRQNALLPGAATSMINWYRAAFRHRGDLDGLLGRGEVLQTPTLMVWGEHDPALGVELTYGTEDLVSDFTIRYLPVSHWVQQEAPDAVNEIVSAWLQGKLVPGSSRPESAG
jgi:pimeloyl-ACP methyl ester carboxylesterase